MIEDPFAINKINEILTHLRIENLKEVQDAAINREAWMVNKVTRWCHRWGDHHRVEEMLSKISYDLDLARFFAKDPQKQSFHEKYGQKSMIEAGLDIKDLPASGTSALYVYDGKLLTKQSSKPEPRIKSVDCICKAKTSHTDYILQKWIADSGGAQDNQFSDIRGYVEQGNVYTLLNKNEVRIIALVDGPYFTPERMGILRSDISQTNQNRVLVLNTVDYIKLNNVT
jgi:hypothetical protein